MAVPRGAKPFFLAAVCAVSPLWAQEEGRLELTITEKGSDVPLPCRVHLKDASGMAQRAGKLPFWKDHFVCPGVVHLKLPPGAYTYEVERGPEYALRAGSLTVTAGAEEKMTIELEGVADLAAEGWWSGDLHVHRKVEDVELLMRAEDVHVAPVITWWTHQRNQWAGKEVPAELLLRFDGTRHAHIMAGEDERQGGALLFVHLPRPLVADKAGREFPSPISFVDEARRHPGAWIDIEKPFWWDVPVWLADGRIDSIGLANNHMCRSQMYENEAWGRPRDAKRLPPPRGNGFWTQEIYYHVLNSGLRVPPSAGSASGVLPNPLGYNRVYVHLGKEFSYEKWWEGLRAGRSFVTNGPLLRCRANGELPGHVFAAPAGQAVEVEVKLALTARDPIPAIEIVKNGQVERAAPYVECEKAGTLGKVRFTESGWFLVRAIADNPKTFRFGSTAPYYVEIGEAKRRVSKASAQFFLDWARERKAKVQVDDPEQLKAVLAPHERAEAFWAERVAQANAP